MHLKRIDDVYFRSPRPIVELTRVQCTAIYRPSRPVKCDYARLCDAPRTHTYTHIHAHSETHKPRAARFAYYNNATRRKTHTHTPIHALTHHEYAPLRLSTSHQVDCGDNSMINEIRYEIDIRRGQEASAIVPLQSAVRVTRVSSMGMCVCPSIRIAAR